MSTVARTGIAAGPSRATDRDPTPPPAVATTAPEPAAGVSPAETLRRKALLRFAISITFLTVVGHLVLGFEQAPLTPVVTVLASYAATLGFEKLYSWAHDVPPAYAGGPANLFYFMLPAHVAPLACAMLLYADNDGAYIFAAVAAAGSKYLFRIRVCGKARHYLNPSNFGIALTLLTMPLVGFAPPYMFLNNLDGAVDWLVPVIILVAGTLLNAKLTRRTPLILGWVGGYVLQAVLRGVLLGDNVVAALGMMTGVAFVLFTNYMITDPGTTPVRARSQVVFGLSAAAVYGLLVSLGIAYAIFFGLILTCTGRGVLQYAGERRRVARETAAGRAG